MARVFENVIGNAVKYSVEGSNVNINLYENDKFIINIELNKNYKEYVQYIV